MSYRKNKGTPNNPSHPNFLIIKNHIPDNKTETCKDDYT